MKKQSTLCYFKLDVEYLGETSLDCLRLTGRKDRILSVGKEVNCKNEGKVAPITVKKVDDEM